MDKLEPTSLLYQRNGDLHEHEVRIQACIPYSHLPEGDQQLYKDPPNDVYAIITNETIFHPQGGGQPSDTGCLNAGIRQFNVHSARTSATQSGVVLHFGKFAGPDNITFFDPDEAGNQCIQTINVAKRLLYSKYHTAGHVLGAAVRHLLEKEVEGFDELKASHFPDSASCEFAGLIAGTQKESIQKRLDEYIKAAMPVEIDWWSDEDFKKEGLDRLIPDKNVREAMGVKPGEKFRVVKIVGAEVYPCGGTHVHTTDQCGKTIVKKISRNKGTSRVSYNLPDA
jgi:Ser-tRNA(Ala) deacylase AlaX